MSSYIDDRKGSISSRGMEMGILSKLNSSEKMPGWNRGRMAARRAMKTPNATRTERKEYEVGGDDEREEEEVTYDLLRSCFFLCRSIILTISRRPAVALTLISCRLMLTIS